MTSGLSLSPDSRHLTHSYNVGHPASLSLHFLISKMGNITNHFRGSLRRPSEIERLAPGGYSIDWSYHYALVLCWFTVGAHE